MRLTYDTLKSSHDPLLGTTQSPHMLVMLLLLPEGSHHMGGLRDGRVVVVVVVAGVEAAQVPRASDLHTHVKGPETRRAGGVFCCSVHQGVCTI